MRASSFLFNGFFFLVLLLLYMLLLLFQTTSYLKNYIGDEKGDTKRRSIFKKVVAL